MASCWNHVMAAGLASRIPGRQVLRGPWPLARLPHGGMARKTSSPGCGPNARARRLGREETLGGKARNQDLTPRRTQAGGPWGQGVDEGTWSSAEVPDTIARTRPGEGSHAAGQPGCQGRAVLSPSPPHQDQAAQDQQRQRRRLGDERQVHQVHVPVVPVVVHPGHRDRHVDQPRVRRNAAGALPLQQAGYAAPVAGRDGRLVSLGGSQ